MLAYEAAIDIKPREELDPASVGRFAISLHCPLIIRAEFFPHIIFKLNCK
jgi:hypothetical protein